MKKFALIADIHANLEAFETILEDMPKVDGILCAGDFVGYGPQPNEVLRITKSKGITSVLGNHDHAVASERYGSLNELAIESAKWTRKNLEDENLDFLKNLSKKQELEREGYNIFIAHGTPRNPLKEYIYPGSSKRALVNITRNTNADIIILGHTHVPLEETIQNKYIINPGSVGQPRDRDPKASYMILKLGREKEIIRKRVSYDIDKTEQKIKNFGLPEKFATRLHFGW